MKMKKRVFLLFTSLIIILSMCSCSTVKIVKTKEITNAITQTTVILETPYNKKEDFAVFLKDFKESHTIPGLLEGVIPQGVCYDETTGYILITGYYEDGKLPSVIMAIDEKTGKFVSAHPLKTINNDDFFGHVGGIAASQNTIYITNDGECYTFPSNILKSQKNGTPIQLQSKFKLNTTGSFACIYNNILWIGDFVQNSDKVKEEINDVVTLQSGETFYAFCEGYTLVEGLPNIKKINSDSSGYIPDLILAIPEQVQGMAFTKTNKIVFSTSYGRKNNSKIYVYDDILTGDKSATKIIDGKEVELYACASNTLLKEIEGLPMAEGMANTPDGFYIAFESGADKYRDGGGKYPTDKLFYTTIE